MEDEFPVDEFLVQAIPSKSPVELPTSEIVTVIPVVFYFIITSRGRNKVLFTIVLAALIYSLIMASR